MTRLQAFTEVLIDDIGYDGDYAACRRALERRIRELARAIDADVQGPAQSYLDEEPE